MQKIKRVYIPGVWDLFHVGHLNVLREAKKHGTQLIVGVCSDEMVCVTKNNPPVVTDIWRREVLDSLDLVDSTVIYRDLDYYKMAEFLGVEVFAVGEEFGYLEAHRIAIEKCHEAGIEVVYIPRMQGISTTELKEKILSLK
jgi:glycerol-3-phosphate cytidylyltransferase